MTLSPPSAERNPPIEEVISQGVIPRFVQFLQRSDLPQLQVRCVMALEASSITTCFTYVSIASQTLLSDFSACLLVVRSCMGAH